ncbi:MAG: tetratricopeptide repeat protein [Planctomycetota bacterium]
MSGCVVRFAAVAAVVLSSIGAASDEGERGARLYPGFGRYHRAVRTESAEAQKWFDQGMQLLYGFNHDEAIRSFREAAWADPDCAMAWWGIAYAHGLHINNPEMSETQSKAAWDAAREATERLAGADPAGQALIRAVARRYAWPAPDDRAGLDRAYAEAMGEAWREHPDDPDVGALYAESLMNLQPWDLWTHEGQPKGRTPEIMEVLEAVLEMRPDHPGANHFYIHTVEASPHPEKAIAAADRLRDLVPGAGHLVHMPAHIYTRVGRYAEAADANERAIAADEAYFELAPAPAFYRLYFVHNVHFLAYAAMMEGRYETAIRAARKLEADVPDEFLREFAEFADGLMPTSVHVLIRFGRWEDILAEPEPPAYRLLSRVMRHYARGVAYSATGRTAEAGRELEAFDRLAAEVPEAWLVGVNPASSVLPLARHMLEGEMVFREGRLDEAFAILRAGAALEDDLVYDEPPGWMQPVRHALGALLMSDGRYAEAEAVYREDLRRNPENGWSLLGLRQSLRAQQRLDGAEAVAQRLAVAWRRADVRPTSSCYCEPGPAPGGE